MSLFSDYRAKHKIQLLYFEILKCELSQVTFTISYKIPFEKTALLLY